MRRLLFLLVSLVGSLPPNAAQSPRTVLIRHASIVDVADGRILRDHSVLVRGDRIEGVEPDSRLAIDVSEATQTVDAEGRYLLPGLWDMHVHALWDPIVTTTVLPLLVAQGVTGIRDMGGTLPVLQQVRAGIAAGTLFAPRVVAAGPMLDGPSPVDPSISLAIATPDDAVTAVGRLAAARVDFLKVYTLLSAPAFHAVMKAAAARGLRVVGHVPGDISPVEAVEAGMFGIEHMRAELGGYCTKATEAACAPIVAAFRKRGTWQTPTLSVRHARAHLDAQSFAADPRLAYEPAALRAEWLTTRTRRVAQRGPDGFAKMRDEFANERWLAGHLHSQGVPLVAGSDAGADFSYHGFGLHDELAQLVAAGLTPLEALQAATLLPARMLDREGRSGRIVAGADADLVLLAADPLTNIGATTTIRGVMSRGTWLPREKLDRILSASRSAAR